MIRRQRVPAALAAILLWATNAYAADVALARLSVFQLLLLQFGTAAVTLSAAHAAARARARQPGPGSRRPGIRSLAVGVIGLTGTTFLQYLAFASAPIVAANVIAYGWPLMTAVWTAATRRTRSAWLAVPLAMLGFGGVALIFDSQGTRLDGASLGYLAALGSAAAMAFYTVAAGRLRAPAVGLLAPAALTGAVIAGIATFWSGQPWPAPATWLPAVYIGAGPMAAGYVLWTRTMSGEGASRLSPLGYAAPLLSTILLIATGRSFTSATITGAALILTCSIGVIVNDHMANHHSDRSPEDRLADGGTSDAAYGTRASKSSAAQARVRW